MKTTYLLTMGLLFGSCLAASAQDAPPKRQGPPPEIVAKFDKDGDGVLSPEERKAMHEARKGIMQEHRKKALETYDADKDGKLSREERQKMKQDREAKLLEKYDKDGDGKLSEEEKAAIPKPPRMGPGPKGPKCRKGPKGPHQPGGPAGPQGPDAGNPPPPPPAENE